jgi:hypothetical protein
MSRLMGMLGLVLFACGTAVAETPSPEGRLLLVDDAAGRVSLEAYHGGFQSPDMRPAGGFAWEPEPYSTGKKLAIATAAVLIMGPYAAGYGAGQEQGERLSARQQWLDPLMRITTADNALKNRMLASLRASLAEKGTPVGRVVVSPDAAGAVLPRAARDETWAVVVRARQNAMVSVTPDDRRIVVDMWLETYERPASRFRKRSGHFPMRYVSGPADGERPLDVWVQDGAAIFWSELERGVRALVSASTMDIDENVSASEQVAITHAAHGEEFRGRLVKRAGDLVYIAEESGGLMIVHDRPAKAMVGPE